MEIALLIIGIILIVLSIYLSRKARTEMEEEKDPEASKKIKMKWQTIFSLIGLAVIIITGISIYLMFI